MKDSIKFTKAMYDGLSDIVVKRKKYNKTDIDKRKTYHVVTTN